MNVSSRLNGSNLLYRTRHGAHRKVPEQALHRRQVPQPIQERRQVHHWPDHRQLQPDGPNPTVPEERGISEAIGRSPNLQQREPMEEEGH